MCVLKRFSRFVVSLHIKDRCIIKSITFVIARADLCTLVTLSITSVSTFVRCRFTSVLVDVLVWFSERDLRSSSLIYALFLSTLRWWNLFNAPSILRSASFLVLLMSVLKSGSGLILARAKYLSDLGQVSLLKWSSILPRDTSDFLTDISSMVFSSERGRFLGLVGPSKARQKVGNPAKRKNTQENSTFCHTIPPSGT